MRIPHPRIILIQGILGDYSEAQRYYNLLKKSFINNAKISIKNKLRQRIGTDFYNLVNNSLYGILDISKLDSTLSLLSEDILNSVEQALKEFLDNPANKSALKKPLEKTLKALRGTVKLLKERRRLLANRLTNNASKILQTAGLSSFLEKAISKSVPNNETKYDILNLINSYAVRYLYDNIMVNSLKLDMNRDSYARSLTGYYLENAEYLALSEYFKKAESQIQVYATGSSKINNIDTEIDTMLSVLSNVELAFNHTENFKSMIEGLTPGEIIPENIINKLDSWGEQSKAWDLSTKKYSYGIGHRSSLLNDFNSLVKYNYNLLLLSMWYLSRYKNILLSLGPTNIFFRTGNSRMWTADFILEFRQDGYALAFELKNKKPTTEVLLVKTFMVKIQ